MKITKRQLKRIIREEKAKLVNESSSQSASSGTPADLEQANLKNYQQGWNAGEDFGIGEEDAILETLGKYFSQAKEELEENGIYFANSSQMIRYIRMAANEQRGLR